MRIAKPLLLITTPLGVAGGIYEAHRLAGGLVFLMIALLLFISAAFAMLVHTIRKEQAEEAAKAASQHSSFASEPTPLALPPSPRQGKVGVCDI
jgi:hypothetical protein